MTWGYKNYSFSAFSAADLLQGSNDWYLGCGDMFNVPADCTQDITVCDNDNCLSGDYNGWWNDNATDWSGQSVSINGKSLHGQIYAESYLTLKDADGNKYTMIKMEVECHDSPGVGNGYYSFYGSVPPAGTKLTVIAENDCLGGVYYDKLTADCPKPPANDNCKEVLGDNLIVNGGFEHNNLHNCGSSNGHSAGLSNWHDKGYAYAQVHEQDYGHGNAKGDAIVELECGVKIAQCVKITEGGTYRLCFDTTRRGHYDSDNKFVVRVDGKTIKTVVAKGDETLQFDIDLGAGDHTVEFASLSQSYIGAGLDNVKLQKVTEVPCVDPMDDAAKTCADEKVTVDVLANDKEANNGALTITQVEGNDISEGKTVKLDNGVEVTLSGGKLVIDGTDDYIDLDLGQMKTQSIEYTASNSDGASATGTLDVTFCGTAETLEEINDSIPQGTIKFQLVDENNPANSSDEAFTIKISGSDARIDGVYAEAYCLSSFEAFVAGGAGSNVNDAPMIMGSLLAANKAATSGVGLTTVGINMQSAADNLDLINYILNQDYGSKGYSDGEIQGAIWALTDGKKLSSTFANGIFIAEGGGDAADAKEILDDALANGEGFEAGSGDIVGIVIDPTNDAAPEFTQPFIIGIEFDDLNCLC